MKYTINKSNTAERYDMRSPEGEGWAIFVIDEKLGFVAVQSDFCDYQYMWPNHGRKSLKHFLTSGDVSYFLNKFTRGERKFDITQTVNEIGVELRHKVRIGTLQKTDYKVALDELSDISLSADTETEFYDLLSQTEELAKIYDDPYGIPFRTMDPPQATMFFQEIWPAFIEQLKQEIAEDERRQESSEPV